VPRSTRWLDADHIIDATGPARDITTVKHPLITNLLRRGFLVPDEFRLGAEIHPNYRAISRNRLPAGMALMSPADACALAISKRPRCRNCAFTPLHWRRAWPTSSKEVHESRLPSDIFLGCDVV
jgi:hypothetical protein